MSALSRLGINRPRKFGIYRPVEALPSSVSNAPVDGDYFVISWALVEGLDFWGGGTFGLR